MDDKIYLEQYDGQTVNQLISLEITHRIDSIIIAFETALDQKREQQGDSSINEIEWTILAIESLEREVNNGGFDQFFTNISYEFVPTIVDFLEKISCHKTAAIVKKAIEALGLEKLDFDSIEERVNADDEALKITLNNCDNEFYKYPDDIESRLFEYIKENRDNIRFA